MMPTKNTSKVRAFASRFNEAAASWRVASDVPYGDHLRQRLDVYAPTKPNNKAPVVIFWHGGSWRRGDKRNYAFVGAALAESGFICVQPNYRLDPEVRFGEMIGDCALATAWVHQNIDAQGGDSTRLVPMGHSAGAHLAALIAHDDQYARHHGFTIAGFIGVSGVYDFRAYRPLFDARDPEQSWLPIKRISGQPAPSLLLHGRFDPIVGSYNTTRYASALREKGGQAQTHIYASEHMSIIVGLTKQLSWLMPTRRYTLNFLKQLSV